MRLDVRKITGAPVTWLELAGHDSAALTDAWRRVHYACQAVVEVGRAFAEPKSDDSHASLCWFDGAQMIDGFFAGDEVGTSARVRGSLRIWDMHLFVISGDGHAIGELELAGHTLEQATGWIVDSTLNILDEPIRHATKPAPDLPGHAVGNGDAFAAPDQFPQAELIRLYSNANSILSAVARQFTVAEPVRTWPHDLDIMTRVVLERGDSGEPTKTVGLGLTPPDEVSAHGYWYVRPWSNDGEYGAGDWSALRNGRWHDVAGSAVGVLDLVDLHGVEDVGEQRHRVGAFLGEAFDVCAERLSNG